MKIQNIQVRSKNNCYNVAARPNFKAKLEGPVIDGIIKAAKNEATLFNANNKLNKILTKLSEVKPNLRIRCDKFASIYADFFGGKKPINKKEQYADTYTIIYHDAFESCINPNLRCNTQDIIPEFNSETSNIDKLSYIAECLEKAPDEINSKEDIDLHKIKIQNEEKKSTMVLLGNLNL